MSKETELEELRAESFEITKKLLIKTVEVQAMMKDGKFIVAYEKLGGIVKVLQQLGSNLQPKNNK